MTHARAGARKFDVLSFTFAVDPDGGGMLLPIVNSQNLLASQRNSRGRDPDDLLPPLSGLLLPTTGGRHVVIGSCSCGETGCGSVSMIVRREGPVVFWEPFETGRRESLHRPCRFELLPYLDAIDTASELRPGEGRARRVGREVLRRLLQFDEVMDGAGRARARGVDWISSWPWRSEDVMVLIQGEDADPLTLPPKPGESDEEYADRLHAAIEEMR